MLLHPSCRADLSRLLADAQQTGTRIASFDLSAFSRLLEYTPEDLTVTVEVA